MKCEEEDSSDEHGWYHCTEVKITKLVDLRLVDWIPARRNGQKFFPIHSHSPTIKSKVSRTPKFTLSAPNKANAMLTTCQSSLVPLKSRNSPNRQPAIRGDQPHDML